MPENRDLLDMARIAELLDVEYKTVQKWRERPYLNFPEPDVKGSASNSTPYWYWWRIRAWALEHRPRSL